MRRSIDRYRISHPFSIGRFSFAWGFVVVVLALCAVSASVTGTPFGNIVIVSLLIPPVFRAYHRKQTALLLDRGGVVMDGHVLLWADVAELRILGPDERGDIEFEVRRRGDGGPPARRRQAEAGPEGSALRGRIRRERFDAQSLRAAFATYAPDHVTFTDATPRPPSRVPRGAGSGRPPARRARRRSARERSIWLLVGALAFAGSGALAGLLTWFVTRGLEGWTSEGRANAIQVATALVGGFGALVAQHLFERWTGRRHAVDSDLSDWLELLRVAIRDHRVRGHQSQLNQLVRHGSVVDLRANDDVRLTSGTEDSAHRTRLRLQGRMVPFDAVVDGWVRRPCRLVVIGEPGYGKTVAALRLLARANALESEGQPATAELFPLNGWHSWRSRHPSAPLEHWLRDELSSTYAGLGAQVAEDLVRSGHVVPVLDGLDEVPEERRVDCAEAIEAYAGRTPPFRPFVVTSRAAEYQQLAPRWLSADRHVALLGLAADQIVPLLERRTTGIPGWTAVRDRMRAGDQALQRVLGSPLRLSIALQCYRSGGADELIHLNPEAAQERLWDHLAAAPQFDGPYPAPRRAWAEFLAHAMEGARAQQLWLHELHRYVPDEPSAYRRFRRVTAGAYAVLAALVALAFAVVHEPRLPWLPAPLVATQLGALALLVVVQWRTLPVAVAALRGRRDYAHPSNQRPVVSWRDRARVAGVGVVAGLGAGALVFFYAALQSMLRVRSDFGDAVARSFVADFLHGGLFVGLLGGALLALHGGMVLAARRRGVVSMDERWATPDHLALATPASALARYRDAGLTTLAATGPVCAVPFGIMWGWDAALDAGVFLGLALAPWFGMASGLRPWLYYHWLRRRMAKHGLLPGRLRDFLDTCATPEVGWLRVSNAYEFRHRSFQEFLARQHRCRR